jgi:TolB-like protein
MSDIFISYARDDAARVKKLADALKARGWAVWWDDEIRGGDEYAKDIQRALEKARAVVVAWSKAACDSAWVKDEAEFARDRGTLVPISLDGTPPPLGFRQFQCTDLSSWRGEGALPEKLLSAISSRLGGEPAPALQKQRSPARGSRWRIPLFTGAAIAIAAIVAVVVMLAQGPATRKDDAQTADAQRQIAAEHASAPPGRAQASPERSVAVLPFVALSSGKDDGYFADGLTEEIINALTTVPDLLVTARTSAFHFKGKDVPIPDIARTLGVSHVVEGSVRRSGDQVRITAQLIRATDGFHLWSETYDRPVAEGFVAQTAIAESIARALGVLLDENDRALMADAGLRDVEAFLAYRRGRELFNLAHSEGPQIETLARANAEFERAIARKPDFAQAYFQHADLYAHIVKDEAPGKGAGFVSAAGIGVEEAARRLAADLDAAFRYETDPGQRLVIQAVRTTTTSDWRTLKGEIARAYAAWDNCRAGLWLGQTASVFGFAKEAHARDVERTRCDPLGDNWAGAGESAVWIGRPQEALELVERGETLRGQFREVAAMRALALLALGRIDEADALVASRNFGAEGVPEGVSIIALQVPAAAGRAEEWTRLKPALEKDPERLLVGAALFGDRETANRAAAAIDAMPLGPAILVRAANRCLCGVPFDLEATPNFARIVEEADLDFAPPAPIRFPLKTW